MAYMLLVVEPIGQRAERTEQAGRDLYDRMLAFRDDLQARGQLIAAESLASQAHAVRVRKQDGRVRLVDGPFAEAKEMIGGFFLLNCATREEALAIAQACPAAEWCTIEVREVAPCYR
ncbi:YciI family protein [Pigmentiphaga sp.]|uniref:YciI family protein n=1 Tax=Pigmentiphaga sp. TaxID=1977564 RepID=UPI0025F1353B|nr:YciI family protein [Pigmentiphaga sp.]MBX6317795.1 dehydrogenase [Pigmentiphaga sp.]